MIILDPGNKPGPTSIYLDLWFWVERAGDMEGGVAVADLYGVAGSPVTSRDSFAVFRKTVGDAIAEALIGEQGNAQGNPTVVCVPATRDIDGNPK